MQCFNEIMWLFSIFFTLLSTSSETKSLKTLDQGKLYVIYLNKGQPDSDSSHDEDVPPHKIHERL